MITPKKWNLLRERMRQLRISEDDLDEKFVLGSGRGGQKLQKTSSCVQLEHQPSGIIVKCQETRFRDDNRFHARRRLCDKLEEVMHDQKSKKRQEIEKIRRQKRRRSRRAKEKMLKDKKHRSETKRSRQKPGADES